MIDKTRPRCSPAFPGPSEPLPVRVVLAVQELSFWVCLADWAHRTGKDARPVWAAINALMGSRCRGWQVHCSPCPAGISPGMPVAGTLDGTVTAGECVWISVHVAGSSTDARILPVPPVSIPTAECVEAYESLSSLRGRYGP